MFCKAVSLRLVGRVYAAAAAVVVAASAAGGGEIEGFLDPYRSVNVAASEPGVLDVVHVEEGDAVERGGVLAHLDRDVLEASLRIADAARAARGQLQSAEAELRLHESRLAQFIELEAKGHATAEELERARTEKEMSAAHVLAVKEALAIKELEYAKSQVQLERRSIRSPIDGVVVRLYKDEGEYAPPNDPVLLTVVQLDPLLATFSVTLEQAARLREGLEVRLLVAGGESPAAGTVEFVSPVTDPQSGTVRVKVRLPNPDGRFRSGEKCSLVPIPSGPAPLSRRPDTRTRGALKQ
ncbi:MAG: efflux RND transporter periplasmic adaptor subunit [Planctomycetes bacterium]|nr:efflux RND transporter periplasmic adaptor subunit [Planctomycetota bacterium]